MEPHEIAAYIGTGLATFGASWVAFLKAIKGKAASPADLVQLQDAVKELRADVKGLEGSVTQLREARDNAKENEARAHARLERAEEQLRRTVTDEEFGAYTRQTTQAINGLTERVGTVTGILNASRG